jgi:hypothetical protein
LSEDQAVTLAERNLAAALRPLGTVVHDLPPNGIGTINGDFYDSSRLILHDDWAPLSLKLHGHLVVAVPANDVLLYGEGKDRVALDAIATLAIEGTALAAAALPYSDNSTRIRTAAPATTQTTGSRCQRLARRRRATISPAPAGPHRALRLDRP